MIVYDPLWETMKQRKVSQYRLIKSYGFSSGQISRLRKNMYVSTHTIGVLCTILNCSISDIMEFRLDDNDDEHEIPKDTAMETEELTVSPT